MKRIVCSIFLAIFSATAHSTVLDGCLSVKGKPIEHFDKVARETGLKKRILVIAQIHGDEPQAGELAFAWIERLKHMTHAPSNYWRIIPMLNPDGVENKTRYNANKIDLNRNFPSKDWDPKALEHWKLVQKSDPRRYPGAVGGSEPETKCALNHLEDFRPDLVVSIHTPYGQFDFDGPGSKKIPTKLLPWKRLGTYPGSLGHYLWDERKTPVLTIELRPNSLNTNKSGFVHFQDYLSDLIVH